MPIVTVGIEKYIATITTDSKYHAIIGLYNYTAKPNLSATLYFVRSGVSIQGTLPSVTVTNTITVIYHQSAYQDILDLLRNESPVFIHYDATFAQITTSMEPIGDGE